MHRESQRSVSSRHRSRIDFLSLYLATIDNRFWPRVICQFSTFQHRAEYRSSGNGFELFTRCRDGLWSSGSVITILQEILPRLLQAVFFIECNSLPIFLTVFFFLTLTIILFHRKGYEGTLSWFPDASYVYYARLYLFYDRQILMHARANTARYSSANQPRLLRKSMHARNASLAQFNRARFQRRMKLLLLFRSFFRPPQESWDQRTFRSIALHKITWSFVRLGD